jgi:hypothetical protein
LDYINIYEVERKPTVTPNVKITSNFMVNALAVGTNNENVTVGSYEPPGVMMEYRDNAENLADWICLIVIKPLWN